MSASSITAPLRGFLPPWQALWVQQFLRGEAADFFREKMLELEMVIALMPHTYQTDGQGDEAIAHLHYFKGSADWWITEKDKGSKDDEPEDFQSQAFGMVDLGYGPELGYISLPEVLSVHAELDFHWKPKTLAEIKKGIKR